MRLSFRHLSRLLLLALLIAGTGIIATPALPALAGPGSGWVRADVVGGGCNDQGQCNSEVTPGSPTLYEYVPDRQPVGRNYDLATNYAIHGGYRTVESRDKCHVGTTDEWWSAGIWHHGARWTVIIQNGTSYWSGPFNQHWAFEHQDNCVPAPTPIPTATPPPPPTPEPGAPTWTPAPSPEPTEIPSAPCTSEVGQYDERSVLGISVPDVPSREYSAEESNPTYYAPAPGRQPRWNTMVDPPAYDSGIGVVPINTPLTLSYDWFRLAEGAVNKLAYDDNHDGQARVRFGLTDLTTGQTLLAADTEDEKELKNARGEVIVWGRTLRLRDVTVDAGLTFSGPMQFSRFDRLHSGAWSPRYFAPANSLYVAPAVDRSSNVTFIPQTNHFYEAWTVAGHGSCHIEAPRWVRVRFMATDNPQITPTITTETQTPLPPTPTPQPPVPNARFTISLHSTLDPDNGVYRSQGNQVTWPAGEVLDFTPRVRITLDPPAPAYDGYAFDAHVAGWSFVSSLGQDATVDADAFGNRGCRTRDEPSDAHGLHGCTYRYIGGESLDDSTEPTAKDMARQAHVFWSVGKPIAMRPDVYVYNLGQLQAVDLVVEVKVVVEVVNLETGEVVASESRIAHGTFAVSLVAPRSVR